VRVGDRPLRTALSVVLFLSGVKLVDVPGANAIVIAGASVAAVFLAATAIRAFRRSVATAATSLRDQAEEPAGS
jgi:ribosomal protein L6P/L9E